MSFPCPRCGRPLRLRRPRRPGGPREIRCPRCRYLMFDYPRLCAGMVVVKRGDVLVLTRGHRPRRGYLDLPGGFLDEGEDPEAAARRELKEETGLEVGPVRPLGVHWDRYHLRGYGAFPTMNFYYLGRWRRGEPRPADDAAGAAWRPLARVGASRRRFAWAHMADVLREALRVALRSR